MVGEVRAYGLTAANVYGQSYGRHHELIRIQPVLGIWWWWTRCGHTVVEQIFNLPEGSVLCRKCAGVEGRRR